jgi:uncharacterized protein
LLKVAGYSNGEIILSDKQVISGSVILADDGKFFPINIGKNIEGFLNNENNYGFLDKFINKEIFLVGCGESFVIPSIKIRKLVHNKGLKLEWLTTKSSLDTFNLLMEDNRSFFALLINEIKSL